MASLAEGIAAKALVAKLVAPKALKEPPTDRTGTEPVELLVLEYYQQTAGQGLRPGGFFHRPGAGKT
jgi:hypothetical protein